MRTITVIVLSGAFGDLEGEMEVQTFLNQYPWQSHRTICCVNTEHVLTREAFVEKVNATPPEKKVEVWVMPPLAGGSE